MLKEPQRYVSTPAQMPRFNLTDRERAAVAIALLGELPPPEDASYVAVAAQAAIDAGPLPAADSAATTASNTTAARIAGSLVDDIATRSGRVFLVRRITDALLPTRALSQRHDAHRRRRRDKGGLRHLHSPL